VRKVSLVISVPSHFLRAVISENRRNHTGDNVFRIQFWVERRGWRVGLNNRRKFPLSNVKGGPFGFGFKIDHSGVSTSSDPKAGPFAFGHLIFGLSLVQLSAPSSLLRTVQSNSPPPPLYSELSLIVQSNSPPPPLYSELNSEDIDTSMISSVSWYDCSEKMTWDADHKGKVSHQ